MVIPDEQLPPKESIERRISRSLLTLTRDRAIDGGEVGTAFEVLCRASSVALDCERVSIWSYDGARGVIVCERLYERRSGRISSGVELRQQDYPAYFAFLEEERLLAADDAAHDPATSAFAEPYLAPLGITSMLDAPIRLDGRLWGVVCHEHVGPRRHWSEPEQLYAGSLADFAARSLASAARAAAQRSLAELNAQLERRVEARTQELSAALAHLQMAQSRLVEREKLAALGALVAGVAHEVNTPLGVAVTAASACGDHLKELARAVEESRLKRSDLARFLEQSSELSTVVRTNLDRAATLIRQFKRVSVGQSNEVVERFRLREAVQSSVDALKPEWSRRRCSVSVEGDAAVQLHASTSLVFQVVSNLVMNALMHAYPDNAAGPVRFRIERTTADEGLLVYEDEGRGVSAEVLRRMWEPFFTTRRGTGGTGIGMNVVWSLIVGQLGGSVEASSAPGSGLRLAMRMPIVPEESVAA